MTQQATNQPKAEIVSAESAAQETQALTVTPMRLIELAVAQNADIDKLSKLMDLQERWEASEAKRQYLAAVAAFKSEVPEVTKNREVKYTSSKGEVRYMHATLDNLCDEITPVLSKHGLSHRWRMEQKSADLIRVTCTLTHRLGYSEEASLEGPPDNTGSKNPVQAVASTVTYLERYTLFAVTGVAAQDTDFDSRVADVPMEGLKEILESIKNAPDLSGLDRVFREGFMKALGNRAAALSIISEKDARKRELLKDEPA